MYQEETAVNGKNEFNKKRQPLTERTILTRRDGGELKERQYQEETAENGKYECT
jgi:hypothetical protein